MARISDISSLTREEREEAMPIIWDEMVTFRRPYEQEWIQVHQHIRMAADKKGPYASQLRHPYGFAACSAIHATLWPALLSGNPPFRIISTNPDHQARNEMTERIIAAQLQSPNRTNFRHAWDKMLWDCTIFGSMFPWIYFRSEHRNVGPIWEPRRTVDGDVLLEDGKPVLEETYRRFRVYHAPWVEANDLWSSYAHPNRRATMIERRVTGRHLLGQSQGVNPIYDPKRVDAMLRAETRALLSKKRDNMTFTRGDTHIRERDELAQSVGAPSRDYVDYQSELALKDVLGREYVVMHFSDDGCTASYAISDGGKWMELRFFHAAGPDGTSNVINLATHYAPQEVYGPSSLTLNKDLLELQDRFFQAASDGAQLTVHPMWIQSMGMKALNPELVTGPGVVLTAPGGEPLDQSLQRLDMGASWMQAFSMLGNIKASLDDGFAQSDFTRGNFPEGRKTAFLTNQVAQAAEGRMKMLHERVGGNFGQRLVRKFVAMNAMHMTRRDYQVYLGPEAMAYIPPSLQEVVEELDFVPTGSLDAANTALRAARWNEIVTTMVNMLPYLKLRPVNEAFRKWLQDVGADSISRLMPVADDTIATEYLALKQLSEGQGGQPPAGPRSPTDTEFLSGEIAGAFGSTAPPGPMDGGRGSNGFAEVAGARF